jgi:enoyl-CoA hydratase
VPEGHELAEAQRLASKIARFPQQTMLSDRASSYDQFAMPLDNALRHEFALGIPNLGQAQTGAALFARGHGRHGAFDGS